MYLPSFGTSKCKELQVSLFREFQMLNILDYIPQLYTQLYTVYFCIIIANFRFEEYTLIKVCMAYLFLLNILMNYVLEFFLNKYKSSNKSCEVKEASHHLKISTHQFWDNFFQACFCRNCCFSGKKKTSLCEITLLTYFTPGFTYVFFFFFYYFERC